jgi:hypothetical protein
VLTKASEKLNLYKPEWWKHIAGKEHRWARSLTSSQCFAVNLFAPLDDDSAVAKAVMQRICPSRCDEVREAVTVKFEHTPKDAPEWLGEQRQATQLDVFVATQKKGDAGGCLLIEVKLGEAHFGSCRGAKHTSKKRKGNPDPARCLDLQTILLDPSRQCWMAEAHSRQYWNVIRSKDSSFSLALPGDVGSCPFRGGLYQLMRNRVLADQLVSHGRFAWADVAVCVHPANHTVRSLEEAVVGRSDICAAFNAIVPRAPILEINPLAVVRAVTEASSEWSEWGDFMCSRYML